MVDQFPKRDNIIQLKQKRPGEVVHMVKPCEVVHMPYSPGPYG